MGRNNLHASHHTTSISQHHSLAPLLHTHNTNFPRKHCLLHPSLFRATLNCHHHHLILLHCVNLRLPIHRGGLSPTLIHTSPPVSLFFPPCSRSPWGRLDIALHVVYERIRSQACIAAGTVFVQLLIGVEPERGERVPCAPVWWCTCANGLPYAVHCLGKRSQRA